MEETFDDGQEVERRMRKTGSQQQQQEGKRGDNVPTSKPPLLPWRASSLERRGVGSTEKTRLPPSYTPQSFLPGSRGPLCFRLSRCAVNPSESKAIISDGSHPSSSPLASSAPRSAANTSLVFGRGERKDEVFAESSGPAHSGAPEIVSVPSANPHPAVVVLNRNVPCSNWVQSEHVQCRLELSLANVRYGAVFSAGATA
ncbi:hypothetical protein SKAU_G00242420 [Synaphobranchus kaupii]|uniref:Uncharacterized protein n=1 Tax=Synaphobranchus kaupii TaxID=118154 RepID=A0A9Q1IUH2_SYNKA|nr:hypothetical protein SKAU_G00242420 [Synaphobranchus kaupii]